MSDFTSHKGTAQGSGNARSDLGHDKTVRTLIVVALSVAIAIMVVAGGVWAYNKITTSTGATSSVRLDTGDKEVKGELKKTFLGIVNDEILGTENYSTTDDVSKLQIFKATNVTQFDQYYTTMYLSYRGGKSEKTLVTFEKVERYGSGAFWSHGLSPLQDK